MIAFALAGVCADGGLRASEDAHPCSVITDDTDRLACYDKAFGPPAAHAKSADKNQENRTYSFSAVVSGLERRGDRFVATLENGQVWSQAETNTRIQIRVGDPVTIRRGALGSYLLSNDAGLATRVKRLR